MRKDKIPASYDLCSLLLSSFVVKVESSEMDRYSANQNDVAELRGELKKTETPVEVG